MKLPSTAGSIQWIRLCFIKSLEIECEQKIVSFSREDWTKELKEQWRALIVGVFLTFQFCLINAEKHLCPPPPSAIKECFGVGVVVAVSPYSPTDQQALQGDWLAGSEAFEDPLWGFRG